MKMNWKPLVLIFSIAILVIVGIIGIIVIRVWPCDCKISPRVANRIEAHPHHVQVEGTTVPRSFQALTWYRDQNDSVLSGRFLPRHWSFSPTTEGVVAEGWINAGLVSITAFPATNPSNASVEVKSWGGSLTDKMDILRWTNAGEATAYNGGSDVVTATVDAGQVPNVVLLEGLESASCSWEVPVAFVGAAAVGEHTKVPCSTTLLSSSHPVAFVSPAATSAWSSPKQQIALGSGTGPLPLNVYVHIAVTERTASALSGVTLNNGDPLVDEAANAARAQAELDVAWANRILHANRIGITLIPSFDRVTLDPDEDVQFMVGAEPTNCSQPGSNLTSRGFYQSNAVNVYYVDWLAGVPDDPLGPRRGLQCWDAGGFPVIYVSFTTHSTTTLAHELGHAFELKHVCAPADPTPADKCTHGSFLLSLNVMYPQLPDGALGADARSHLTIGQSVWSNVHDGSWINVATNVRPGGTTRTCTTLNACPPLDLDIQ